MDTTTFLLRSVLLRAPVLLVFAVGVIVAIVRWKRHPKVSLLTLLGLFIWQFEALAFTFLHYRMNEWFRANNWNSESQIRAIFAVNVAQDLLYSVMLILLVVAAFSRRVTRLPVNS